MTRRWVRTTLAAALLTALTGATSRGCTGEAGTAPNVGPHKEGTQRVWLVATGQGTERGHILVRIGKDAVINDVRDLPWQKRYDVPDDAFLEFQVTVVDRLSGKGFVKCYIYAVPHNKEDPPLDEDGPAKDVDCVLAPIIQPA